ncbi:hypothetical protein M231_08122, partial [Tremella mesenterica]
MSNEKPPKTPGSHSSDHNAQATPTPPTSLDIINTKISLPFSSSTPSPTIRFPSTTNAFGLSHSPGSGSSSSSKDMVFNGPPSLLDKSPLAVGVLAAKKLRRPSMLSLAQTASFTSDEPSSEDPVTSQRPSFDESGRVNKQAGLSSSIDNPFAPRPVKPPAWSNTFAGPSSFPIVKRTSSAPPMGFEGLSTTTPPIPQASHMEAEGSRSQSPMDLEGLNDLEPKPPLLWMPNHLKHPLTRRKGKGRPDDIELLSRPSPLQPLHAPPLSGRPLPASLLATLVSEASPLEHEMRSEARLQRLLSSHPSALPLTPRAPRSSRGRFPEMVGGDDDDDDEMSLRRPSWAHQSWGRTTSSDSDSDEMPDDPPNEP